MVNIVDLSAWKPFSGYIAHSVGKAALLALTRQLALELALDQRRRHLEARPRHQVVEQALVQRAIGGMLALRLESLANPTEQSTRMAESRVKRDAQRIARRLDLDEAQKTPRKSRSRW